jgi:Xaa-Pro aminopeptidase
MAKIAKQEFQQRTEKVREIMTKEKLDAVVVFGDEYRREYVRYLSNFWPIFEKSAVFIFNEGDPVVGGSAECEAYAREQSVWPDIKNVEGFGCVTVPDEIDFPFAEMYSFEQMFNMYIKKDMHKRIGVVGLDLLTVPLYEVFKSELGGREMVEITAPFNELRLIKSKQEIECMKRSFEIADMGYQAIMDASQPGVTEFAVAAAGEYEARKNGAEIIPFCNVESGLRTNTVIGRATDKVLQQGDIMSVAIAVQYEGYISTVQFPYSVGGQFTEEQHKLVSALVDSENKALPFLKNGEPAKHFVKAVRDHFRSLRWEQYDIYPPLHGAGTAEAESPYPDEKVTYDFQTGMCVNVDISLFNTPAYSNRIEEGFYVTDEGAEPMSKLVRKLATDFQNK